MPRAIWTGAISFGLVTVPVKLYPATESKQVRFRQFERDTGERIRYERIAEDSGHEVDYEDVVRGHEVSDGEYVIVTPEELESVEPRRSRSIEIEDFIDLEDIDPVYFQTTYYLVPADDAAVKPFVLLRSAMRDANRVGIARLVMRSKEHLAAIRPGAGEVLLLETMYFADEIRDPAGIDEVELLSAEVDISDRERSIAVDLVESLSSDWEPGRYADTYRARVLELVERKAEGEEIVTEEPELEAQVVDLMAALERSVEDARGRRRGDGERHDRLEALSRDELYEEAQQRDIPGRSTMSKEELAAALADAS